MYSQLMKVSRGFRLVYIGLVLFVLALLGGMGAVCLAAAAFASKKQPGGLANVLAIGMLLCILGASITGLIGRLLCLAIPSKAGSAKVLIVLSVGMELTGMTMGILNQVRNAGGLHFSPTVTEILQMGWVLLSVGSAISFLLFTKAAARFMREEDLAEKAASVLWLWAAMFGCYVLATVITLVVVGNGPSGGAAGLMCVVVLLLLGALVLALRALFRYVGLMRDMSDATEDYARSVRRAQRNKRKRERKRRELEEEEDDEEEDEGRVYRY
jgi:hypothetical protein